MSKYKQFFPYPAFRPQQERMLDAVDYAVTNNNSLMVSAPTGAGKSTVVIPAIVYARAHNKKVIVATRTKSQIGIFVNELEHLRQSTMPDLKFSYMLGKEELCPNYISGVTQGSIYTICSEAKKCSKLTDKFDNEHSNIDCDDFVDNGIREEVLPDSKGCYWYKNTYWKMNGSECMRPDAGSKVHKFLTSRVDTTEYKDFVGDEICPYEIATTAARYADVVIVNYKHILDDNIREAFYNTITVDPRDVILITDEAHNLGSAACDTLTVTVSSIHISKSKQLIESSGLENDEIVKFADYLLNLISKIVDDPKNIKFGSVEKTFNIETIIKKSNINMYKALSEVSSIAKYIHSKEEHASKKGGEQKTGVVDMMQDLLKKMLDSSNNPSYLGVISKNSKETPIISIRNIDPSALLTKIVNMHSSMIMISGTLSPLDMYELYYFGKNDVVNKIELDNIFPKENRFIYIPKELSSESKRRDRPETINSVKYCIEKLCEVNGNVAVFFTGYPMMDSYIDMIERGEINIGNKKLYSEPRKSKNAMNLLDEFKHLPKIGESGLLFGVCGGKFSEGIDYKGDMLHAVLVYGFPLTVYSDIQKAINSRFIEKYGDNGMFIAYFMPAINRALQALGRVIRTENDKGLLILGDYRFARWIHRMPVWIREEAIITQDIQHTDITTNF